MKSLTALFLFGFFIVQGCTAPPDDSAATENSSITLQEYHDSSGKEDQFSGGVRLIKISTPKGDFNVWTKRVGNNPTMKVLLLHGGPGGTQ